MPDVSLHIAGQAEKAQSQAGFRHCSTKLHHRYFCHSWTAILARSRDNCPGGLLKSGSVAAATVCIKDKAVCVALFQQSCCSVIPPVAMITFQDQNDVCMLGGIDINS